MSGWDRGDIYHVDLLRNEPPPESDETLQRRCRDFFAEFCLQHRYVYREAIAANVSQGLFHVTVDLVHLQAFDEDLLSAFMSSPQRVVPALEEAAQYLARQFWTPAQLGGLRDPFADFQVRIEARQLQNSTLSLRDLDSSQVGRFVRIAGIVVSTGAVVSRPVQLMLQCRQCEFSFALTVNPTSAIGPVAIPATCPRPPRSTDVDETKCARDSLAIVPERCHCVDQQTVKLQEAHDAVPVGELPRHIVLLADRSLANSVTAGSRVIINGVFSVFSSPDRKATGSGGAPALRTPFVKVLGYESLNSHTPTSDYDDAEEKQLRELANQPGFYDVFAHSIAPSIFGCDDVKRALACLLVGGTARVLPDRVRLRGDINVLLLGDPGMAKSQFLKFVERVAPICVYTSGKGSSAAGLTASVIRDPRTRDFYLEGGAMVLADGGVCCIDEFDKMGEEDRVAIHEAMEQQTISIAKAGITTVLNSRASVLAAANPVFGRYDDLKGVGENIDFGSTILSRFDLIFVMKDEHNVQRDIIMARHVIGVHQSASGRTEEAAIEGEMNIGLMKKFIAYCRQKCFPRLSALAADKLVAHYVSIRSRVQELEAASSERSSIPITIRYPQESE